MLPASGWLRSVELTVLGLSLAVAWCLVLAVCLAVIADVLQLFGPVSLGSLYAFPFAALGGPPTLIAIARVASRGVRSYGGLVQISPYLPRAAAARLLERTLEKYRGQPWAELCARLWDEEDEAVVVEGFREAQMQACIHPAAYDFEGGNVERFDRLTRAVRDGGNVAVTATLHCELPQLPWPQLRARARFEMSRANAIERDAGPFLRLMSGGQTGVR